MLRGIIKWGIMLSVCIILMFFYGCSSSGGGGSSGSSTSSSGSSSSSFSAYSYYKFYIDSNSSSLYAIDPNNPTSPVYVDDIDKVDHYGDYWTLFDIIVSFQYDASTYTALHKSYIIYSKNSLIYKLPTAINAGLIPTQVSNLNTTICDLNFATLNSNPDLDFISVETAGTDGVCYGYCATTSTDYSADNQHYLVRLDMSSTDAPISIPQKYYIDDYYYNYNTGNIGGVFIDNNGAYEACDENLANCITLNATDLDVIGDYPGKVYLCINGTEIYSFDKATKALTLINQLSYELWDSIQDGNDIYFDSNSTIYKLDTTSNTLTPLYIDTLPIDDLNFTDNKIVYNTSRNVYTTNAYGYSIYDYTVYSIKTLNKTGGIPTTIYSFNSTGDFDFWTTSDKIIISTNNATLIYDENGNLLQTFNGRIIGIQYSNSGSMLSDEWPPVKILIDNNVTSTLNAISMSDLSITTMTQSLPTDIVWWGHTYSLSNIFLITGVGGNINYPYSDIFFFDTSKANSFIRVTNTPDIEISL